MKLQERMMTLIAARFERDPASLKVEDDLIEALGIDSMDALSLLTELEAEFDVEIPDWEMQDVRTFDDLKDVLERCGAV